MDPAERFAPHALRLRYLLTHLAGSKILGSVELEDLEQEVWLRAVRASAQLPPEDAGPAALYRWLARLARNAVVDVARALRAARRDGTPQRLDRSSWSRVGGRLDPAASGPGPATHAASAEASERLRHAFGQLSAPHRRVLGLRQFEGLSAAETAVRMGRSEVAIHSLYRRALEAWSGASGLAAETSPGFSGDCAASPDPADAQ